MLALIRVFCILRWVLDDIFGDFTLCRPERLLFS